MKQLTTSATEFDRHLQLESMNGATGRFSIDLPVEWSALVGVHGGYLTAVAARGAELLDGGRHVRTLSTSFLRPARPGTAELTVTEIRRGRSLTTATVEIEQDGRAITTTRITLADERDGVEWQRAGAIPLPPLEDCVAIAPRTPSAHFERARALLDPSSLPFTDGARAMVRGYLRPLEPRPIDAAWLAMASDWFPPPAFVRVEPPVGGISLDLVTHVHHTLAVLADDVWLQAEFEVTTSVRGMATEHGRIVSGDGILLAESFQTRWMVPQ